MDLMRIVALAVLLLFVFSFRAEGGEAGAGLSFDFYSQSCPNLEDIVRAGLRSISFTDPTTPAAMLRLMFHDCQVQGCDASILLDQYGDSYESEISSSRNFGIRKRESINLIKSTLEAACPGQVSCADILVLAAREAVAVSGGPRISVPLGRRDSSSPPSSALADTSLPAPNVDVDGMLQIFAQKGLSTEEAVAIIGAHTLGVTHCRNVQDRLYKSSNISPSFEMFLRLSCPLGALTANTSTVLNDPTTLIFDNQYYANVINGLGVLIVDAEMPLDPRTAPFVRRFAADEAEFFRAFSSAFVKLSTSSVLTGAEGVIRKNCNVLD